jgi:hypothetical protein
VPIRAAALVALAGVLGTSAAHGQPADEARVHFESGAALASERKYEEAAREFKASYDLDPRKEALFAWAQVERLGGNCAAAVELYRKFMASPDLTATQTEAAELNIRRCQAAPLEQKADARVEAAPATVAPAPAGTVVAAPDVVAPRSRRAVVLGAVLLGGAVATLGGSITFFLLSRSDEREASSAENLQDYYGPARRAIARQRLAAGLLGASVVLGGGALLDWLTTAPRAARLTAWVDSRGAGASLGGRY